MNSEPMPEDMTKWWLKQDLDKAIKKAEEACDLAQELKDQLSEIHKVLQWADKNVRCVSMAETVDPHFTWQCLLPSQTKFNGATMYEAVYSAWRSENDESKIQP